MLQELSIKNFALIDALGFSPSQKLSTITGETGAGKSILLGALGLILGERVSEDVPSLAATVTSKYNSWAKFRVESEVTLPAYTVKIPELTEILSWVSLHSVVPPVDTVYRDSVMSFVILVTRSPFDFFKIPWKTNWSGGSAA